MNKEQLRASDMVQKMLGSRHEVDHNLYSKGVMDGLQRAKELPIDARLELYGEFFDAVWDIANELSTRDEYNPRTSVLDLGSRGLGRIRIQTELVDDPEVLAGDLAFRMVTVSNGFFEPPGIFLSDRGVDFEDPRQVDDVLLPQAFDFFETLSTIKTELDEN